MQEHSKCMKPQKATGVSVTIATSIGPQVFVFDYVTPETFEQKFYLNSLDNSIDKTISTQNI